MARDAPSLRYDDKTRIAANDDGFGIFGRLREMGERVEKLESHRQSHLDRQRRAISVWVRDALKKDTPGPKKEYHRPNEDVVHGDVRS